MANRIAVICLSNLALVFLYSSRNNLLVLITKWQRSTFVLVHHWLGYIVVIECVVHASIYLHLYLKGIAGEYAEEHKEEYWKWGTVGIVAVSAIGPLAVLPVRQKAYELFRIFHNLLAALTYGEKGFHNWIYASLAVLAFDRVARIFRLSRNGLRMAEISVIDQEYVRVDIKGISAEGHAYIYFPTLSWRVWENHPFSVAASVHSISPRNKTQSSSFMDGSTTPESLEGGDQEKVSMRASDQKITSPASPSSLPSRQNGNKIQESSVSELKPAVGVTFFVRRQTGMTSLLFSRTRLPVLVESSYGALSDVARFPNLIAIAGGVGIVTVLPLLRCHPGRTKLYWGMRTQGLYNALRDDVSSFDKEIQIGPRLDITRILESEIVGELGKGACIVVSGPGSLADDVRKTVSAIGKRKGAWPIRFIDESFN